MWDLKSLTRDQTCGPRSGSIPTTGPPGIPISWHFNFFHFNFKGQSGECPPTPRLASVLFWGGDVCHRNIQATCVGKGRGGCSQDRVRLACALPIRCSPLSSCLPTPAFDFYQGRLVTLAASPRASGPVQSSPYVPQCDAFGGWEPMQCYAATGEGGRCPGGLRDTPLFIWEKSPTKEEREEPCTTGQAKWTLGLSWQLVESPLIPLPSGRSVHTMGVVTFYLPEDQVGSCWGFWGLRPLILDYVRESRQGVG